MKGISGHTPKRSIQRGSTVTMSHYRDVTIEHCLLPRRSVLLMAASTVVNPALGLAGQPLGDSSPADAYTIMNGVLPKNGVALRFGFGMALQRLIAAGVLDPTKYRGLYQSTGGLPEWVNKILDAPSDDPIVFSLSNAAFLLNLLWPLGLASRAAFNESSPINTLRLPSFASTGGWSLGKNIEGYRYFNAVDTLNMTPAQEASVLEVAQRTFRPCCDNSTFFQDCNHGSALLGLLELAASLGATTDELYRVALVANSYWFPDKYVLIAISLQRSGHPDWNAVSPSLVMGETFSSLSGWRQYVCAPLLAAQVTLPDDLARQLACGI